MVCSSYIYTYYLSHHFCTYFQRIVYKSKMRSQQLKNINIKFRLQGGGGGAMFLTKTTNIIELALVPF